MNEELIFIKSGKAQPRKLFNEEELKESLDDIDRILNVLGIESGL